MDHMGMDQQRNAKRAIPDAFVCAPSLSMRHRALAVKVSVPAPIRADSGIIDRAR